MSERKKLFIQGPPVMFQKMVKLEPMIEGDDGAIVPLTPEIIAMLDEQSKRVYEEASRPSEPPRLTYMLIKGKPVGFDEHGNLVEKADEQSDEVMRDTIRRIRQRNGTKGEPAWFSKYVPIEEAKDDHSPDSPPGS